MKTKKETNKTEQELLYELLADKMNAIDPNRIIYTSAKPTAKGHYLITVGGRRLSLSAANNLQKEAQLLKTMEIYKLLTGTLSHYAHLNILKKATDFDGMRFGKALLYAIDIIEQIVHKAALIHMDELSTPAPSEPRQK